MKKLLLILAMSTLLIGCKTTQTARTANENPFEDWNGRVVENNRFNSVEECVAYVWETMGKKAYCKTEEDGSITPYPID